MSTASSRRHARGASAGSDLRSPAQTSHLALVSAFSAADDERPGRTPQEAFCARLRAARERRGIPVKMVAEATKVAASLFEALERGDLSRWPKGLYKRAFFRGYVTVVGLPADSTVEEFLRLFPDEKPVAGPSAPPSSGEPVPPAAPLRLTLAPETQTVPLYLRVSPHVVLDAAVVVVLALVLAWWSQADLWTAAAIVALSSYPALARLARSQAAKHRARHAEQRDAAARPSAPEEASAETAHITAPAAT